MRGMATLKLLTAGMFLAASSASYSSSRECDFSAVDQDDGVEQFLARLPSNYTLAEERFVPVIAGLEVGPVRAVGLNRIKRYGAVQLYCEHGRRFLQVDLINDADVAFYVPWRTCSGQQGHVMIRAEFSRFTVLLRVDRGGFAEKFVLRYEGPVVSVNTHNVYLDIEGAGKGGSIFGGMLTKVLPSYINKLWNDHFFNFFTSSLRKAF